MPVPIIDSTRILSLSERLGVVRKMTRVCRVVGLDGVDYSVLNDTLTTLGVPVFGESLTVDPSLDPLVVLKNGIAFQMLVLVDRDVSIVDEDPGTFDVTLNYEHIMDGPYQNLLNPTSGVIWGKTACSVTQKSTNFFREYGEGDVKRLLVGHTYKPGELGPKPGYNGPFGGEVNVLIPQKSFKVEGYINTGNPSYFANQCIGCVNNDVWLGDGIYEWMCTEVQYEILTSQGVEIPGRYKFFFEWQHNKDTWNPTIVYTDSSNGGKPPPHLEMNQDPVYQPPVGLTLDTTNPNAFDAGPIEPGQEYGYSYIPYYKIVSFNNIFQATFGDWTPGLL